MKYSSINQLSDFEFHDAEFILKCYDDFNLYATAKYLNVHKDAKENPYDYDMEIEFAHICFEHIQIHLNFYLHINLMLKENCIQMIHKSLIRERRHKRNLLQS